MREAVIVAAARTATGKFLGSLKDFTAPQLGAVAVGEVVRRAGIDPAAVDECIMGNVVAAGEGQNPARQAALHGGLHEHVAAMTINKVCGSGLKAVMLAAQGIATGDIDVAVAGGMESMSNTPYLVPRLREGLRMGNGTLVDAMIQDGLWCAFEQCHMGMAGEHVAEHFKVSRGEQDAYAAESHRKAAHAIRQGWFRDEIVPVEVPQKKGAPVAFDRDEAVREDTSAEALAGLKAAFKKDGTVTAGNAPGVNDGASALVVTSEEFAKQRGLDVLATIVSQAYVADDFAYLARTPAKAGEKALAKAGKKIGDVERVELNEAFSSVALNSARMLDVDPEKVNVNGGAVALGHPIGASGGRILSTMIYELRRNGGGLGLAAICSGGGQGDALLIEV
jgi:acetyl-CoA C-acetyltransferase